MATTQPRNEVGLKESFFRNFQIEVTGMYPNIIRVLALSHNTSSPTADGGLEPDYSW